MKKTACFIFLLILSSALYGAANDCACAIYPAMEVLKSGYKAAGPSDSVLSINGSRFYLKKGSEIKVENCGKPKQRVILVKGSVLVISPQAAAEVKSGDIVIKTRNAVFFVDENTAKVYQGSFRYTGRKGSFAVAQGNSVNFKTNKIFVLYDSSGTAPEDWADGILDKWKVVIAFIPEMEQKYRPQAEAFFRSAFSGYFFNRLISYKYNKNEAPDFNVKINGDIDEKNQVKVKAVIENTATGGITAIVQENQGAAGNDDKAKNDAMQTALIKAAAGVGEKINSYYQEVIRSGTAVYIELSGLNQEQYDEIKESISGVPGINIIKERAFYGQKRIIEVNYPGTGADLTFIINGMSFKKSSINIWKYSQNVVKLSKI